MSKNKKTLVFAFALSMLVFILSFFQFRGAQILASSARENTNAIAVVRTPTKLLGPEIIKGSSGIESSNFRELSVVGTANKYILENPKMFPIQSYHRLEASSRKSPLGSFVTYHVFQDGYRLIGLQIDLLVSNSGKVKVISNQYQPIERVDIEPQGWLSLKEVLRGQETQFKIAGGLDDSAKEDIAIWTSSSSFKAELVYVISVIDLKKNQKVAGQAVFSVTDGHLLARHFPRAEF